MPIKITREPGNEELAWLCDDEWHLPEQLEALENWLVKEGSEIEKGYYAADIGYSPRPGAAGGGGKVSHRAMEIMLAVGMELYLSEYPEFVDEPANQ